MRKIILMIVLLAVPSKSHAAGLKDLIINASPDAKIYLYGVIAIFAVGIIGMVGSMILSAFGNGRVARLVTNGSYLAAVGIFISLAMMLFQQFVQMIVG